MIRRILSAIISVTLIGVMLVVPASAESENTKSFWSPTFKFDRNKDGYSFMERFPDDIYLRISENEKANGKYSLHLDSKGKYNNKSLDSDNLEQYFGNTEAAYYSMPANMKANTDYTFSVKLKIADGGSLGLMRIMQTGQIDAASSGKVPAYYFVNAMDVTDSENGWKIYTQNFNSNVVSGAYLHFLAGGAENVYVDDLYLKDNTNNQVLLDYGFEDVEITDLYAPTNIKVSAEEYGKIKLSWRNPLNYNVAWNDSGSKIKPEGEKKSGILSISLYDVTDSDDPENYDISSSEPIFTVDKDNNFSGVNLKPNEISECTVTGLDSNKEYKFLLVVKTDKTNIDKSVTENVSKTFITGKTLEVPEGWVPPVETLPNFHHILVTGFMNDAENTNDPSLNISFWNPKADNISEITLDRIINGEEVRVQDTSFKLSNNAINEYEINGLTKGEKYSFKLNCTFADGTKQSAVFDGIAGTVEHPSKVNGWVPYWSIGAAENTPAIVRFDTTEKHSGESSVYINAPFDGIASSRYVMYQCNGIAFKAEESYTIGFWAKANNCASVVFYAGWSNGTKAVDYKNITDKWEYHEITMKNLPANGTQLLILVRDKCEDLWIDDISVIKDGEENNLISNPECEVESVVDLEALLNVKYEAMDKKVRLTWTNALLNQTECVNIYDLHGETQSFKGKYSDNEAIVYDLINDKEHTLILKPLDKNGKEGKEVRVKVVPTAPAYSLLNEQFSKDNQIIDKVESGNIVGSVLVKNKSMGDDFKVTLIAALYDGEEMVTYGISENTVLQKENSEEEEELTVNITVPDDADEKDYQLKLFMWDSVKDKNILKACKIIETK